MLSAGNLQRVEDCETMRLAGRAPQPRLLAEKPVEFEQKDHKYGREYPRGPVHPVI
jgi:hypothetical protein